MMDGLEISFDEQDNFLDIIVHLSARNIKLITGVLEEYSESIRVSVGSGIIDCL